MHEIDFNCVKCGLSRDAYVHLLASKCNDCSHPKDHHHYKPSEFESILRKFVEDVKLAYGNSHKSIMTPQFDPDSIDEKLMDWPELAKTYKRTVAYIKTQDKATGGKS